MAKKKYLVRPGRVVSINDGDVHQINYTQLIHLHGVPFEECIADPPHRWYTPDEIQHMGLTVLTPARLKEQYG